MAERGAGLAAGLNDLEFDFTRLIDAPRALVYKAWTEPARLALWWGPSGFTNPVCNADARPGGAIYVEMRGPDGSVYPMGGVFHELVEPERIVFTTRALRGEPAMPFLEVHNTVTFTNEAGKTRLTVKSRIVSATPEAAGPLSGMEQGWNQSLDRLAGQWTVPGVSGGREIAATRVLDAPRALVYRMWTDPAHIGNWWGPDGFTITVYEMDVRPGGHWRFTMHGPDGVDYENEMVYVELVEPERIVFDHVAPPFRMTARFAEADCGKTRLDVSLEFESAEMLDQTDTRYRATEGLGQTLGRLTEYVAVQTRSD